MKPASCRKPGYTRRPAPGYQAGTVAMTFSWNHAWGRVVACWLTAVGALRVSIVPPIIVGVRGRHLCFDAAMTAASAQQGTDGWHHPRTLAPRPQRANPPPPESATIYTPSFPA